jgi:hypothetical protein
MIQATELRIGNWIAEEAALSNSITYCQLNSISKDKISVVKNGNWIVNTRCYYCLPIPLTPEILEKCGFVGKYKSCGYSYTKNIVTLTSQDEDDLGNPVPNYVLHFYYNYQGAPLYYLHQLQNLYFVLTGEELNISLT